MNRATHVFAKDGSLLLITDDAPDHAYLDKVYRDWATIIVYQRVASAWNADIPAQWDALVSITHRGEALRTYRWR